MNTPLTIQLPPHAAPTHATLLAELQALLDEAQVLLEAGQALPAFRRLGAPLSSLWSEARGCGLAEAMREHCRAHPLHRLVQQDPYTHRAVAKPRGYAGDAVMMDFIYDGVAPTGTSALGALVFGATTRVSMGLSVLYRRQLLRSLVDEAAVSCDEARILSVASGHARELEGSLATASWFRGEVLALDQDALSCDEVARVHAGRRVRALHHGVRELLAGPLAESLGRFDLVYSAGLYDYLPDALARRLTTRLYAMLRPGGRLVIGNFVPGGSGRGYMELFMDWTLVLRTAMDMRELADAAGANANCFLDPHGNVVYAELNAAPAERP